MKEIKTALISVFHKENLETIIKILNDLNVSIYSTGGTQIFIESIGVKSIAVENIISFPSILSGRVKTLHPKIFGGILSRRNNEQDTKELKEHQIPEIDLVIVDLYPFEQTVSSDASQSEIIEKIDIGGISLIRAAAKNFNDVTIISSKEQYSYLIDILSNQNGKTTIEQRHYLATQAFNVSSSYDTSIFNHFNKEENIPAFKQIFIENQPLRYGENPHQQASFFGDMSQVFDKLNGKEISYNNLLDIDAAINLINEFTEPTFAILKHNNACGIASRDDILNAWLVALETDPISAFGGVLIANREIDEQTAKKINEIFFEVILAPKYSDKALETLKTKKNRIILKTKNTNLNSKVYRTILNGVGVQTKDNQIGGVDTEPKCVTEKQATQEQIYDLIFANKIVKHTKSNAIVLVKNRTLISSGTGQTSRVDALKQAIDKAHTFKFSLENAVMASDAFFPFADCVEIAHKEGVVAVIQPGGSIRDQDSIDYCNKNKMIMIKTELRHFKH